MKNLFRISFLLFLLSGFVFVSCDKNKDDDNNNNTPENKTFETLKTYLIANDLDLPDVLNGWITTAENVYTIQTDSDATNDYYIIDIRSASDFSSGHIDGSVNSTFGDVLTAAANANGHTIIVVCYTGQTAAHAVVALRLSGYKDAKVMKWGMSGWNAGQDHWTPNVGDVAATSGQWEAAPGNIATKIEFGNPVIESSKTDGADILKERVQKLLSGGFSKIGGADVLADPSKYFVNNYWAETDVQHYGHIKGAYRIKPLSLEKGEYKYLSTDKTVVTYCWTGQTSSMVTAYLTVLGYSAKSLTFGANGMIHSDLKSHKWSASFAKNYPLVTK
jgi:rhodanese-related sulfurtransferase